MQRSLIVTFYAYKGGTGRTLALANVARFLADEMGYRVGLVDLDIESPGLAQEALCSSLEDKRIRPELLKSIDRHQGFLECFIDRSRPVEDGHPTPPNVTDYVVSLNSSGNGSIVLMPTAAGSVSKPPRYSATVECFMEVLASTNAQTSSPASPGPITLNIFTEFIRTCNLDFLFLDGRTGTGPFFPVYVYSIPHLLVLFLGLNDQNILGSLSILNAPTEAGSIPAPVLLVASPVPTVGPAKLEERLSFIASELARVQSERDLNKRYIYSLPGRPDHLLPYSDAASFGEVYFPGTYPHSLLARAYRRLAASIENLVLEEPTTIQPPLLGEMTVHGAYERRARNLSPRLSITMEDVHRDLLKSFVDNGISDDAAPNLSFAPAEEGPWQGLAEAASERDSKKQEELLRSLLPDLPDILVIPQILLHTISKGFTLPVLYDLSDRTSNRNLIDYGELDRNYPNWRRWCSVDQKVMALPFSANAMLMCANEDALAPICRAYWKERGQKREMDLRDFFIPSSWPSVMDLVRSWKRVKHKSSVYPFRVVGARRGLYYDWLNVVTSLGGFDLMEAEGRVIQGVALDKPETIEATELFVQLSQLWQPGPSMGDQIRCFAGGQLALYVGWTDSFRFTWEGDVPCETSVVSLSDASTRVKAIRLGRCPRDMRYRRTPLVDGWLMTFPNNQNNPARLKAALAFADWFLQSAQQTQLLQRGFPSASGKSISREIELLGIRRLAVSSGEFKGPRADDCFEVFLDTMRSAVFEGRWVASPRERIDQEIESTLAKLIQGGDSVTVDSEMRTLARTARRMLGVNEADT